MSDDGANLNIKCDAAMKAVLGGDEPETLSDAEFASMIRGATVQQSGGYEGCANRAARLVLEHLEAHPDAIALSGDDLYAAVKGEATREDLDHVLSELTGFMWGWAVNAARHVLKRSSLPNPAILTIGG